MKKEEVIAKLKEYEGRTIEIGLADEGAMLYGGIDGHWLFTKDNNLIEIKKNSSDGTYGFSTMMQQISPFIVTIVDFDTVNYIRTTIDNSSDDINKMLAGLTPVGTTATFDEIKHDIETNSIRKANSARGFINSDDTAPGTTYGGFKGSIISTSGDGLPKYAHDLVNRDTEPKVD